MQQKSEKIAFQAQVAKVLDIVIHSLYSNKEIFLRELISNGADACEKLRYASLTHPELAPKSALRLTITPDKKANTLTITDNGIGMNREDLINHLGTIARSGSAEFFKSLSGDKQKDMALIGQFGVGFYASFMVADKVKVRTKKAGEKSGWLWESSGTGDFTITPDDQAEFGTSIILSLKKEDSEYTDAFRLRHLIKQYSDFIAFPIYLTDGKEESQVNAGSALWMRPKSDITGEQYKDFYQTVSGAFDTPWETLHAHVEGVIDYTALLFVPTKAPVSLFQPDQPSHLSLYVNQVFISNDMPELMPYWLRFLSGVIDTKDLPLNVSREMLQQTPVLTKIKQGLTKKVLAALKKRSEKPAEYKEFWDNFGVVLKEGLYEPSEVRDEVADLCRFYTTQGKELSSLADYVKRMKPNQDKIYFITGADLTILRHHPQLENLTSRGIEVLLLIDPVDEFWTNTFGEYQGKKFCAVQHAGDELNKVSPAKAQGEVLEKSKLEALKTKIQDVLKNQVQKVEEAAYLTDSPMALTTGAGEMSLHLERLMRMHGQQTAFASTRVLQINPCHPLIHKLADMKDADDYIKLLYDQTLVAEGEPLPDAADFVKRLTALMMK